MVNALPNVTLTPAEICEGDSVTLSASGADTYEWSPANGLSCTGCADPIASPSSTTVYTLLGTDLNGCQNDTVGTVTVKELPVLSVTSDISICAGEQADLQASGADFYLWSPASGLSCTTCSDPTVTPSATTTYTVIGTGVNGCSSTETVTVIVNPLPTIIPMPTSTICLGDCVQLTATGASIYVWTPQTGLDDPSNPAPLACPMFTTEYTVTGTDLNGCQSTATALVIVNPLPVVSFAPAGICEGDSVSLIASGATTYQWIPSTGLSCATCPDPIASPTITTSYALEGTDHNGCSNTMTGDVTVWELPTPSISPDHAICHGQQAELQVSGGATYQWQPPASLSCDACSDPVASPSATTTYTVTVTSTEGCGSTATTTISVMTQPEAQFDLVQNSAHVSFSNGSVDALTWQWDFGDGNTSTLENPEHTYTSNGEFTITLIVTNGDCSDTTSRTIQITGVGIVQTESGTTMIFPNPTEGVIYINPNMASTHEVRLLNNLGQLVADPIRFDSETTLDLTTLAAGVYFVELRSGSGSLRQQVIKL